MPADRHDDRRPDDETPRLTPAVVAGQRAITVVLLTMLLSSLPHPWSLAALLTGLVALALALRAVAGHLRDQRWGWAAWHLVAVAFAGYLVALGGLRAAYPVQMQAWTSCSRAANTHLAQGACDVELLRTTPEWLGRALLGS